MVSYSIGSTYSPQNANLGLTNTTSTTQPNMGSHITYFMVPSGVYNTQNYNHGTFQQPPSYATMNPFVGHTQTQGVPLTQTNILTQQLQNLQQQVTTMQTSNDKKSYTMKDLRPFPFDHTLYMPPFPPHFEMPKFDRYQGKGDPREHIREFFTTCIEVAT